MGSSIDATVPLPFNLPALPNTINHTPWPAQNFLHVDPAGDVFHVLVCRTTYSLRGMPYGADGIGQPVLLPGPQQPPLVTEDVYEGALNSSSVVQESDFAPYKPLCDVLLVNATAYAPGGRPTPRWSVGLRFGKHFSKLLNVTGPRHYERSLGSLGTLALSQPQLATQVPLSYQLAYGGPNVVEAHRRADQAAASDRAPEPPAFYIPNPIGTGRLGGRDTRSWVEQEAQTLRHALLRDGGDSLAAHERLLANFTDQAAYRGPQIESTKQSFAGDERDYAVLGYGPIARWWQPRHALAGTHDERWRATQWPKSPLDHDYRYWCCAPQDQQVPYPQGGEEIVLVNLTPPSPSTDQDGSVRFALPEQPLCALVRMQAGPLLLMPLAIDTIVIDLGAATLAVVRRVLVPSSLEVRQLELGTWRPGQTDSAALAMAGAEPHRPASP